MAHQFCFPYNLHTVLDAVATIIHVLQRSGNHIHVIVGIDTTGDAEAQQVESAEAVFACYGIAVGQDITDFATPFISILLFAN